MRIRKWTIFIGLAITVAFSLVLPMVLTNKEAAVAVAYEKKKEAAIVDFKDELIMAVAAVSADDSPNPLEGSGITTTNTASNTGTATASNTGTAPNTDTVTAPVAAPQATELVTEGETPLGAAPTVSSGGEVKDEWVQAKIDENKDKISDADLDKGAAIFNNLDTDYIFGLADGGLTDAERAEVDTYLKSELSGSDYELAKSLYFKYVGLLNE